VLSAETVLATDGLTKDFEGLRALNNLDINVARGTIHGLIGPNGAGKTTFFNVITGILPATEGKVHFEGKDITNAKPHFIAQEGISRTFQSGKLAPDMTTIENVMTGAYLRTKLDLLGTYFRLPFCKSKQEMMLKKESLELLDMVGLVDSADRWAKELVWVERQLVQIARAIAARPKLLLLDEPTGGMGDEESLRVEKIIRHVRDNLGTTVIVISHDVRLVIDISDFVTCINFGEKISEGDPKRIQKDLRVLEAYLGKE
jgi:branched-chain amino acid transport system ATP-binding protein